MIKTAWITGAGKGIGRAVALRLAKDGVCVAVSARTREDLESLAGDARDLPGAIHVFPLDVTEEETVHNTVYEIEKTLGPLDLVILNAGTHGPTSVEHFEPSVFQRLLTINVMGVVNGLAAVLPQLIERKSGHVAVVSSVAGYRGLPGASAYGASKAALINMCEAFKPELDRHNVTISLINPGFVKTPLTDQNDFPMPFLMSAEIAAERIVGGLATKRFEITFPRRFTWFLKFIRCMPYAVYFWLTRRIVSS
ncbi:MAG: SDR family NAD(P)-dependent oxidoreductase [Rhodospirillaceae bacterium]|jgi:NAD(P)-dependent dehydrogenase (short-subunit alcohol dehydrogenase family)